MSSQISFDALLNEYKGNLFEFLVGLEFAKVFTIEENYLNETYTSSGDILEQQESFLRNYYPELLSLLPLWAKQLVQKFVNDQSLPHVEKIMLVGKQLATTQSRKFHEADLLLNFKDKQIGLSIKLAKANSFVNTKSAGVKSFFKKYFSVFDVNLAQDEFNQRYDELFEIMAMKMHEEAGLIYDQGFENWEQHGLPSLPGKLQEHFKTILFEFYGQINSLLFEHVESFYEKDGREFLNCIWNLSGKGSSEIFQIIAFHKQKNQDNKNCDIYISRQNQNLKIQGLSLQKNSFEIQTNDFKLQLRLKPMNTFTQKAYKVNCSIKYNF